MRQPNSAENKACPPLNGITVVALEHAIAAPLCTRYLAELGARVIKVERRDGGDFARHYDSRTKGQSSHFIWTNRGKQSMTLNLKHEEATGVVQRLLGQADVLVQNLAPGAARRLGLSYEQLQGRWPRLICCNITGYGEDGPYRERKAYDLLVQAEAGFLSVTGTEQEMVKSGISIADIAAGTQAHSAILAALLQRGRTGTGSRIDISMLEAMVEWMGFPLYYAYDDAAPPPRTGSEHASIFPYGTFSTQDGETLLLGIQNEREWQNFCELVLEDSELVRDPRFRDNSARSEHRQALRALIGDRFSSLPLHSLGARLDQARIAWARVNDMAAVWKHQQLKALDRSRDFSTPAGLVRGFEAPARHSGFSQIQGPVPALGEHTRAILAELDFQEHEIETLYRQQVV